MINKKKNKKITLFKFNETKQKLVIGCYIKQQTFSPNGDKIANFYTVLKKNNQRQILFYHYCLKKKNYLINLSKSKLISHYCWKNEEILFTMKEDNKCYSYILYNIKLNKFKTLNSELNKDGHPSLIQNIKIYLLVIRIQIYWDFKSYLYTQLQKKIIWKNIFIVLINTEVLLGVIFIQGGQMMEKNINRLYQWYA